MPSLSKILKSKIGKGGKSKAYVANHLGVSEKTIENYMNGKREPKNNMLVKLAEILVFNLSDLSNDSPQNEQNVPREISKPDGSQDFKHDDPLLQELISSNKLLAEASLKQAERDKVKAEADKIREEKEKILVQSNYELGQMLKPNSEPPINRSINEPARLMGLLDVLAEMAFRAGIYESEDQAAREIGMRLLLHVGDKESSVHTRADAGRKSTA